MAGTFLRFACVLFLLSLSFACQSPEPATEYAIKVVPLQPPTFQKLPLGTIKPRGWLRNQLLVQASGLTGHLDEFWPDLLHSSWKGGEGDAGEIAPLYVNGLLPLAYQLENKRLIAKSQSWIEAILTSQQEDGWFGPSENQDLWPLTVAMKAMMSYYEVTEDARVLKFLQHYFMWLKQHPQNWIQQKDGGQKAMEIALVGYWLYRQLPDPELLNLIQTIQENSFQWTEYFLHRSTPNLLSPEIDEGTLAMGLKYPALWYLQSGDKQDLAAVYRGLEEVGLLESIPEGDGGIGEKNEKQSSLCSIVEQMYSLEQLMSIVEEPDFGDRLEYLAYNALPGSMTPDCWSYQSQPRFNQVQVSHSSQDGPSNEYGLMPKDANCLANLHQAWPKFVEHMWMRTSDSGLAVLAYGPNEVNYEAEGGAVIRIEQTTDYPFQGEILFTIHVEQPLQFPLHFRIPKWADGATIFVNGREEHPQAGNMHVIEESWENGQNIRLTLPMPVRMERQSNQTLSLLRGPLYFSLRIDKEYEKIQYQDQHTRSLSYLGTTDWEISPTSPWNFVLKMEDDLIRSIQLQTYPIGILPFADEGEAVYVPGNSAYTFWETPAPVVLELEAYSPPNWKKGADIPISPVERPGRKRIIQLVPYGSARLRITGFPWTHNGT